jgi:hypothetical protein
VYGLGLIAKTDSQDGQPYYLANGLASTTGLTNGRKEWQLPYQNATSA